MQEITIAAVGDILINGAISTRYHPKKKNPITGFSQFNSEQLAAVLQRNGLDVMVTAMSKAAVYSRCSSPKNWCFLSES